MMIHMRKKPLISAHNLIILLFSLFFSYGSAKSEPLNNRSIVVLEFRSGVKGAANLADSLADLFAKQSSYHVISPTEARKILGDDIDLKVAECRGDPQCISIIGKKLKVDEVLLVGLSEMGDLIIAIQRINVDSKRILSRFADSIKPRKRIKNKLLTRYLHHLFPATAFKRFGRIIINTNENGDRVFINNKEKGKTPLSPLALPAPFRYEIKVSRLNHNDFVASLNLEPKTTISVSPTFTRQKAEKWYKQWWVWTIVGGVVAIGTSAAIYGLSQSPDKIPATINIP